MKKLAEVVCTMIVALGVPIYLGMNVGWGIGVIALFGSWCTSMILGAAILYYAPYEEHPTAVWLLGILKLAAIGFAAYYLGMWYGEA